jgi:DNA-binding PadR family transcriptional regulator
VAPHESGEGGAIAGPDPPDELGVVEPRCVTFGVTARSCRAPHRRWTMLSAFAMRATGKARNLPGLAIAKAFTPDARTVTSRARPGPPPTLIVDIYIREIYESVRVTVARPPRKQRQNRTRFVVLGMLTIGPMTGYGLRQRIAGSVGYFWQESYGQLYPTLRALVAERLVEARPTRGRPGRSGATYHLTARGHAALATWVAKPSVIQPKRNEVLLKVFFGGAVGPRVTARNLERVAAKIRAERAELEAIAARVDPVKACHPNARYGLLTLDFGLTFERAALEWIEHARKVIGARGTVAPAQVIRAARRRRAGVMR